MARRKVSTAKKVEPDVKEITAKPVAVKSRAKPAVKKPAVKKPAVKRVVKKVEPVAEPVDDKVVKKADKPATKKRKVMIFQNLTNDTVLQVGSYRIMTATSSSPTKEFCMSVGKALMESPSIKSMIDTGQLQVIEK